MHGRNFRFKTFISLHISYCFTIHIHLSPLNKGSFSCMVAWFTLPSKFCVFLFSPLLLWTPPVQAICWLSLMSFFSTCIYSLLNLVILAFEFCLNCSDFEYLLTKQPNHKSSPDFNTYENRYHRTEFKRMCFSTFDLPHLNLDLPLLYLDLPHLYLILTHIYLDLPQISGYLPHLNLDLTHIYLILPHRYLDLPHRYLDICLI